MRMRESRLFAGAQEIQNAGPSGITATGGPAFAGAI
jgi:hypothetical protein